MEVIGVRTASLGDATYLVTAGEHAIIVDPQRDIGRFQEMLAAREVTLTHVLETHMHNDYISGGRDLAKATGAELILPAGSGAGFAFVPAFHREVIAGPGLLTIEPLHTPGHTPAHISYLMSSGDEAKALFSGGSLLVGAAGRSDLLGDEFAHQLAVLQYGSLRRLAALPDDTGVYPTHGEGSFCTASGAGRTTSTIGVEKAENPLLSISDVDAFVENQLSGLVPYPSYYQYMGGINRRGPTALAEPKILELGPGEVAGHLDAGDGVLDGRDRYAFAAGHVPGSVGIELGDSFAPWAGWLLDFHSPVVLILGPDDDVSAAAVELGRIGLTVAGVMRGVEAWARQDRPLASYRTASSAELAAQLAMNPGTQVLDVRDPLEWKAGHIEGSVHTYVPDLLTGAPSSIVADQPVWVICRTGNRASIAAGLLEGSGLEPVVVAKGGVPDLVS